MARKLDAHTKVVQLLMTLRRKVDEAEAEGDQEENDELPPGLLDCFKSENIELNPNLIISELIHYQSIVF